VLSKGASTAEVYFPARSVWFDFYTGAKHAGGMSDSVKLEADHIPVYVRGGAFIPMAKVVQSTRDYNTRHIELHYYHDASVSSGSGKLYDDDGLTANAYEQGQYELLSFTSKLQGRELNINVSSEAGKQYQRPDRSIALQVHNVVRAPSVVRVDGKAVMFVWDETSKLLSVTMPASGAASRSVSITL